MHLLFRHNFDREKKNKLTKNAWFQKRVQNKTPINLLLTYCQNILNNYSACILCLKFQQTQNRFKTQNKATNKHTHSLSPHPPHLYACTRTCTHTHTNTHAHTHRQTDTHAHTHTHKQTHIHTDRQTDRQTDTHTHTYTEPSTGPKASSSHLPDDELSAQSVASLDQLLRFPRWQRLLFTRQRLSGHDGVELLQNDVLIVGRHQVKTVVKGKERKKNKGNETLKTGH